MLTALKLWWSSTALPWLKKYWMWLLLPIGMVAYLLRSGRREVQVVAPEATGAAAKQLEETERYVARVEKAAQERRQQQQRLDEEHVEDVTNLVEDAAEQVPVLQQDPKKTTDFLKNVGKNQRKP